MITVQEDAQQDKAISLSFLPLTVSNVDTH